MAYKTTTAVRKIAALKKRVKIIQGGSSAGKTIAIMLLLIARAQAHPPAQKVTISVVSENLPHLKRGVIRNFLDIMQEHKYYKEDNWNRTDFIYTFETGSKIEFFSADASEKVRGPRRDILFINEANLISYETYTQLAIRTNEEIYLDYNPVSEFWAHNQIDKAQSDFIILTYKDNEALSPSIIQEIESRRGNKNFWAVYGEGQVGHTENQIFSGWTFIDEIPPEARLERYGLDFGYTNDPTAIVAIYYYNGGYILDEVLFQKGMSNKQIADTLLNQKKALVIADSAEPKSIDEIRSYGINILPATKGAGSVNQRIQMAQDQQILVTKRSLNVIQEYRNYLWETDRDGLLTKDPEHLWSHSMDAFMYGMASLVPMITRREMLAMLPQIERKKKVNPAR
jgi:phage terminase large subunit